MSSRLIAELFLFGTTLLWGSTFVVMKWGLLDMSPLVLLSLRFSIASVFFCLVFPKGLKTIQWKTVWAGSQLGLLLFLGFALQTGGLVYTTASKSAFITGLLVIFTPFVQVMMKRRRPTTGNLLGVLIVCMGLWLLIAPSGGFNRGDIFTLLCALAFSVYIVFLDIVSRDHGVLQLTFIQMLAVAVFGWIGVGLLETPALSLTEGAIWSVVYLAVAATLVTGLIQTRYQRDTTPTRAAIIFTIEPIWAALFAAWMLNERLGIKGIAGGVLILLGVLISELSDRSKITA